jgi:hypothetical protein
VLNAVYYIPVIVNIWSKDLHGDPDPLPGLRRKPVQPAFALSTCALGTMAVALGVCVGPVTDVLALGIQLL